MAVPLTSELSVAGQISVEDVLAYANEGFKTLICNRPDGESPDQTAFALIEAAAKDQGLAVHYLPVVSGQMTEAHAHAFGEILKTAATPVLAYCRSGMRSTCLWALSGAFQGSVEEIVDKAAKAGYDISPLASRIPAQTGL